MSKIKFEFDNSQGQRLAGLLEMPPAGEKVKRYAIFAHCFTCGKDIAAASRISRALASHGIAVLRFDFTGLGNSDGDFANTNFSSNVADLLAAASALEADHEAPALLIGHSLGGAAVLAAAGELESVRAVVTIGAPATADHVQHLLADSRDQLLEQGEAKVKIGFREFNIRKQLLDDLESNADAAHIAELRKPLLIFHSPVDAIVSIDQAARIYQAARHPKSFVSLDQADHLLTQKEDAEYVANTLAAWAGRYLALDVIADEPSHGTVPELDDGEIRIDELDHKFLRGVFSNSHQWLADEPIAYGGSNLGPSPYDQLLAALGTCTSMTIRMYANHKELPLEDVQVTLSHDRVHAKDCAECEDREGYIDRITRKIAFKGALTEAQSQRLLEIADRCPVHRTLENQPLIITRLLTEEAES